MFKTFKQFKSVSDLIVGATVGRPQVLMSVSGMVEIPRLQAKRGFVMPADAGIQVVLGPSSKTAWIPASAGKTE